MNPGGIVLTVAGIWMLTQIFGGKALERLRILGSTS